ncbi:Dynactin subunit 2 [Frankliniella fusca]|uniref:Dynactin subunit 2 n=1 Tax=Frankliniella fusca TaxID=407009 RepID=A0AAE1HZ43_9NEOP|nr:Dynactin subunit 2 [Frankliniella fusca]
MADPKYANLPGIAYDQPDVYETDDLPEADQNDETFEEENECIERLHLSAADSYLKFKDKQLSGTVDFSDRLKKVPNRGYDARSGVWELAGEGEKETILQKYQRLQCEMKEFLEEVEALKVEAKGDKKGSADEAAGYKALAANIERAQKQLSEFRLEETLGPELLASLKDPETAQIKKLFAHFETYKQKSTKPTSVSSKQKTAPAVSGGDGLQYQLRYRPEQSQLQQTSRVTDLEQRLNKLESILGTSNENMARLGSTIHNQSITEAVEKLESRYALLLEPSQIETAEARLTGLASKLDSVAEKVNGQSDPEKDAKVTELYELVKKTESISSILPQTIRRLTALESLHREASEFSSSLAKLEAFQLKIASSLEGNEKLLQSVNKGFAENIETVQKNMAGIDQRIAALKK